VIRGIQDRIYDSQSERIYGKPASRKALPSGDDSEAAADVLETAEDEPGTAADVSETAEDEPETAADTSETTADDLPDGQV
jgi:hypothetical protein